MFSIFKTKKALEQALIYINTVNRLNDELIGITKEQLIVIQKLNDDNRKLRNQLEIK